MFPKANSGSSQDWKSTGLGALDMMLETGITFCDARCLVLHTMFSKSQRHKRQTPENAAMLMGSLEGVKQRGRSLSTATQDLVSLINASVEETAGLAINTIGRHTLDRLSRTVPLPLASLFSCRNTCTSNLLQIVYMWCGCQSALRCNSNMARFKE